MHAKTEHEIVGHYARLYEVCFDNNLSAMRSFFHLFCKLEYCLVTARAYLLLKQNRNKIYRDKRLRERKESVMYFFVVRVASRQTTRLVLREALIITKMGNCKMKP